MRSIEIDEAVYRFLVRHTREFGETPSDILRRLLEIPPEDPGQAEARASDPPEASESPPPTPAPEKSASEAPGKAAAKAPEKAAAKAPEKAASEAQEKAASEALEEAAAKAPKEDPVRPPQPNRPSAPPKRSGSKAGDASDEDALLAFLESPTIVKANATTRYLEILGFLAQDRPDRFESVLDMGGRTRKYFGKTKREIEESGKSTSPRAIPNSRYWAMTSTDHFQKRDILREAMERMKYDEDVIRRFVTAVR